MGLQDRSSSFHEPSAGIDCLNLHSCMAAVVGGGGGGGGLPPVVVPPVVLPLLVPTCHVASNPAPLTLESEVKSTCKYPVDDVYSELTEVPDSRAICSGELHDDDEQRLMVTKSQQDSVLKEVKERRISLVELMSHLQSSP